MTESKKNFSVRDLVPAELGPQGFSEQFIEGLVTALEAVPKHLSGTPVVTVVTERAAASGSSTCTFYLVPGDWESEPGGEDWQQLTHKLRLSDPVSLSQMTRVSWVITKALDHMGLVVHTESVHVT